MAAKKATTKRTNRTTPKKESTTEKNKKAVLGALYEAQGLIATACAKANIGRTTYYEWYNSDPLFKAQADAIQELIFDKVESKILEKIKEGDTSMLIFYAKTKMKNRGFVERQELTGKDGEKLQQIVNITVHTPEEEPGK